MEFFFHEISRDELRPGDHIYSWRTAYIYAHHGIYVGDGQVIHFSAGVGTVLPKISSSLMKLPCRNCRDHRSKSQGGVTSCCLDCFLAGGKLYRYQYNVSKAAFLVKVRAGVCTTAPSDPPEDVLHRANFLLSQNGFGDYNLIYNNCETFAIYCKTSLVACKKNAFAISGQVNAVALTALVIDLPGPGTVVLNVTRLIGDVGMEWRRESGDDVIKVLVEELVAMRKAV